MRQKATRILADFLDVPASDLPPAKVALTRLAERYYQHKVLFADPNAVAVWRWDAAAKKLVRGWPGAAGVTKDKAEEYYGTRFAKEALALDPGHTPAQIVLLSLALEKGAVLAGGAAGQGNAGRQGSALHSQSRSDNGGFGASLGRPASRGDPAGRQSARRRGRRARRPAWKPRRTGAGPRSRTIPNRRVQMAAADALMRIPGEPGPEAAGRIVEVWRRALAATPTAAAPQGDCRLLTANRSATGSPTR